jgi:hypothetical protein
MALGETQRFQEVRFRDPRYLVLLGVAAGTVLRALFRERPVRTPRSLASTLVLVYWFTAFVVWLWLFCYYRYFAVGEFLAPVALVASLSLLAPSRWLAPAWLVIAATLAFGATHTGWGRVRWSDSWYRVRLPKMVESGGAAVIVDGNVMSYVLPAFPPGTRFFGLAQLPDLRPLIVRELWAHPGPVFRLTRADQPASALEPLGLRDSGDCETVRTRLIHLGICRLVRTTRSRPSPEPASRLR